MQQNFLFVVVSDIIHNIPYGHGVLREESLANEINNTKKEKIQLRDVEYKKSDKMTVDHSTIKILLLRIWR